MRRPGAQIDVAVVGTGMAGLITAHLLAQDAQQRYKVHVFESGPTPSLDSASIDVKDENGQHSRIDIPMRALTSGYYPVLKSVYDHLGIACRRQKLRFIFSEQSGTLNDAKLGQEYFIHASNNHEFPPSRPPNSSLRQYLAELLFVSVFYVWFTIGCFLITPGRSQHTGLPESLREYLDRLWIPKRFASLYLLPLISAVATCSHEELLNAPASDLVGYRKAILFGHHLVVSEGVQKVEEKLVSKLNIQTNSRVTSVEQSASRLRITIGNGSENAASPKVLLFDRVVLAVPPNVAAKIFEPVHKQLSAIPTRSVTTVVHHSALPDVGSTPSDTEDIRLCTSRESGGWTHASHYHGGGIMVTSNCGGGPLPGEVISKSNFTRTLRTPASKDVVDRMFVGSCTALAEKSSLWVNGDHGVWMTGAWCWDGMVLLEGAAVSAVRVAKAFGVDVPWL